VSGTVCVVGKIRDLILQLSKSSIYSTKPIESTITEFCFVKCRSRCLPNVIKGKAGRLSR
ncbi:hypothetical protein FOT54_24020, partial [Citrobacter freundii]|nr:hypothetical protein [Citrobacter freundii]